MTYSVQVPTSFPKAPPSSTNNLISLTWGAMSIHGDKEASRVILAGEAGKICNFLEDKNAPSPLQGSRFTKIKDFLYTIGTEDFSGKKFMHSLAQTAVIANSYISYVNNIVGSAALFPYSGFIIPIAFLYLTVPTLDELYTTYKKAKTPEDTFHAFSQLMGTVASCLKYAVQSLAFATAFELSKPIVLALSTLTYSATAANIFSTEYESYPTLQEKMHRPPPLLKM